MEIKQLKYFLSVSELGSFSKAAVMLSVAQPVLSRQIRSLEEELGMELLYRNGRGIVLTEAGVVVVEHARSIVETVRRVASEIETMRAEPRGKLVIGMPPTAGSVLTVPLIRRFREAFPGIKLKVQEGYSGHVLEWLSTGRIDVAVLYNAPKTSTLSTQPLIEEELMLVGPRDTPHALRGGPLEAKTLAELPLVLPSHPHGLRVLIETLLGTIDVRPNVEFEIDSLQACLGLVQQGAGYTVLPYASIHRQAAAGELVAIPIVEPRMTRQLVLATSTQRPTTPTTRALAQTVSQLVRDLVASGIWLPRAGASSSRQDAGPPLSPGTAAGFERASSRS
ncbi:MAG TPA: LysR substrate-binding domain-containing protein [Microvirga sp.]|nr:LysR substrate-binding domain-containing protein [Microvirga sp.]